MPRDDDEFDFFVSYARSDNSDGWITRFIDELLTEHRKFSGGRELTYFFDKKNIRSFDDWQFALHEKLKKSRLFLAFISPSYFASEWCRKEWKKWIDTEISKHILSGGAAAIYFVEVPGFVGKVPGLREQSMLDEHEVARQVAELCHLPEPRGDFIASSASIVHQMRDRRQITADFLMPFQQQGIDALRRKDLRHVLEQLARDLDKQSERVRKAADSLSTVPKYNERFSGRLKELLELRQRLTSGAICGVHGLGGIGKTELAFTYAHAFASGYPGGRFLVPCDGKPNLREAILHLGDLFRDRISDGERKTTESYFAAITACLRERLDRSGHILLVLDNVSDLSVVSKQQTDLLTVLGSKLHLLATTRLLPPSGGAWLTLGELPDTDALDLLEKHRPFLCNDEVVSPSSSDSERVAALRIVKRLGGFTLAVELVAAWLSVHHDVTYADFLERLGLEDLEALTDAEQDINSELCRHNHERRLVAILGPTVLALKPLERCVLEYSTVLPPDVVALPWLRELASLDYPTLNEARRPGHASQWEMVCQTLFKFALFSRSEGELTDKRLVRIHRLVQTLVRRFAVDTASLRSSRTFSFVCQRSNILSFPSFWGERSEAWELRATVASADYWMSGELNINQAISHGIETAANISRSLLERHAYAEAHQLLNVALKHCPDILERDHHVTATCYINQADLLREMNRLEEADRLARAAISVDERRLGSGDWRVARDLNIHGLVLHSMGNLTEAEQAYNRALSILRGTTTECESHCHLLVSIIRHNVAYLFRTMQRFDEAISASTDSITEFENTLGRSHPLLGSALNNLAVTYHDSGRLNDAEPYYERAINVYREGFGPRSLRVATTTIHLAQLISMATGRKKEAINKMRSALEILTELDLLSGRDDVVLKNAQKAYWAMMIEAGAAPREFDEAVRTLGITQFTVPSRLSQVWRKLVRIAKEAVYK